MLAARNETALGRRSPSNRRSGAGRQAGKIQVIAAVQRQFHDVLIRNHLSDRGRLRIEKRGSGSYLYGFRDGSRLEFEIDARNLIDVQLDFGAFRASEARVCSG